MAGSLLESKLHVPKSRATLIARPRLITRLNRGTASGLTLVSAPSGFGKTTLLAGWLSAGRPAAWLSLDRRDNDPTRFWTYLVAALTTVSSPDVGAGALALLRPPRAPIEDVLTVLLNDLGVVPTDIVLVLDDYHVIDAPEVHDGMAFLLEHLPPRLHLVIACRADPAFPLGRMRARGELVEIRAADLRFTPDEAAAYLRDVAGLDLAAEDVAALEDRTEGWIAALQLAALSMQGRDDVSGFVARFAGNDRYIVDYLVEEVLEQQPEPVRRFLLQSAVLDRLTGPLCDAVTGRDDGSVMLTTLERANLFLVPLDDRREWYRYHHLFADVLRARMLGERPEQVPALHLRASHWYEQHDLVEDAVAHALAAPDVDRAANLMELAMTALRRARQDGVLLGWMRALPDDAVRRSPVLSVCYGWMLLASGDLDAVETRLDDAERALAAVPDGSVAPWADTDEVRTLPATIAVYRASVAQARGDVTGTSRHARRALELAGPTDHLARGAGAGFLGLAAWADGDVTTALRTFTEAVASLHAAGNRADELSATVVLADMWLASGRPDTARQLYRRALRVPDPPPQAAADLHVGLSELDREAGDLTSARQHLDTASALADRGSTPESRFRWFVAMARAVEAEGDPDGAVDLLDQAEQRYVRGFFPEVRPIPAMRARVRIAQGALAEAVDWARRRGVSAADEVGYLSEFDHLTLVRLLIAQHRADEALGLLDRLLDAAEASGRAGSVIEIRMLAALAYDARGQRARALDTLGRAMTPGYVRLFLDEGAPMTDLLRDAEPMRRLLGLGASPDGPLTERELQVLTLLDSDLTGPQIARELFVTQNTLRSHTKHIFTKLDVTSRRAAVRRARERGLL